MDIFRRVHTYFSIVLARIPPMGRVSIFISWRYCAIHSRTSPCSCDARDILIMLTTTGMDMTTTFYEKEGHQEGRGDRQF